MTLIEWIAQILGILGIIVFLFTYHGKNVKQMLLVKLAVDVIWGAHYLLLGAVNGFATNAICVVRELILLNNDKKLFKSKWWLVILVAVNWIVAIVTWKGIYSILPALVSTLATWSFWIGNPQKARYIGITNNTIMFTYDIFVGSYTGLIAESLAFCSVLLAIFRNKKQK